MSYSSIVEICLLFLYYKKRKNVQVFFLYFEKIWVLVLLYLLKSYAFQNIDYCSVICKYKKYLMYDRKVHQIKRFVWFLLVFAASRCLVPELTFLREQFFIDIVLTK